MSTVIKIEPDEYGCHTILGRSEDENFMGDGWVVVPDHLERLAWNSLGFCDIEFDSGFIISMVENVEAREQWQAEHTEPTPQMTTQEAILDKLTEIEYRQDLMELGLTEGGI